jgi:hypothetical protein
VRILPIAGRHRAVDLELLVALAVDADPSAGALTCADAASTVG